MKSTMVKETTIRENEITDNEATYRYMLTMNESRRVASYRIPLYSISVEMTKHTGEKTEAVAKDIFADIGKAVVFFDKIVQNKATPLNLYYIIEDEIK